MTIDNDKWMTEKFKQLSLAMRLPPSASFDNYCARGNEVVVHALKQGFELGRFASVYLWGAAGVGKSHLLHAMCQEAAVRHKTAMYLSLAELAHFQPEALEGLESYAVVCLDDIQAIGGQAQWETALFHLYNRLREHHAYLIMAGTASPNDLVLRLPDLRSRLSWGLVFQLQALDDEAKMAALQAHARSRGMDMNDEVAGYLLRHSPRAMPALMTVLDLLDEASIAAQRKLTVPFVKALLETQR